jgi:hypothetical protein
MRVCLSILVLTLASGGTALAQNKVKTETIHPGCRRRSRARAIESLRPRAPATSPSSLR